MFFLFLSPVSHRTKKKMYDFFEAEPYERTTERNNIIRLVKSVYLFLVDISFFRVRSCISRTRPCVNIFWPKRYKEKECNNNLFSPSLLKGKKIIRRIVFFFQQGCTLHQFFFRKGHLVRNHYYCPRRKKKCVFLINIRVSTSGEPSGQENISFISRYFYIFLFMHIDKLMLSDVHNWKVAKNLKIRSDQKWIH
jgi:hypothetical protein